MPRLFKLEAKDNYCHETQQRIEVLVDRRQQLLVLKNQESNKLETLQDQEIIRYVKEHIEFINKQMQAVEESIDKLTNSNNHIKQRMASLQSIPGVGKVLATHVIAQLPELGKIEIGKLTALVGIAPYDFKSGTSIKKRSRIAFGRPNIRRVLFMAAIGIIKGK